MDIVINEELKAYIDPLTPEEYEALERSLLAEGCRDALVLWGDLLVDGHNRYEICRKHGLPFQTVQSKLFGRHRGRAPVDDRPAPGPAQRVGLPARRARAAQARDRRAARASWKTQPRPNRRPQPMQPCRTMMRLPVTRPGKANRVYPEPAPLKSREDLARRAPEQRPGRADREDPPAGRARAGRGAQVGRDLDQRGSGGRDPAARGAEGRRRRRQGTSLGQAARRVRESG